MASSFILAYGHNIDKQNTQYTVILKQTLI
jgi:hypothetical protein